MTQPIFLCQEVEIPPNSPHRICPAQRNDAYLLYKVDGALFMTDELCTHGQVSLRTGELHGHEIYCPLHGGAFDIRTGAATEFPCKQPIRTHRVELVGSAVFGFFD